MNKHTVDCAACEEGYEKYTCSLHAAAPELLEALQRILGSTDCNLDEQSDETSKAMKQAYAVLAKAKGGSTPPPAKDDDRTPPPWKTHPDVDNQIVTDGGDEFLIGELDTGDLTTDAANAAFIVQAVNMHGQMLELLQRIAFSAEPINNIIADARTLLENWEAK